MLERAYLMSRDDVVAVIENDGLIICNQTLLPSYFRLPGASLRGWLEMRSIDTGRTNSRLLRKTLGVRTADKAEIALSMNAAMITDSYWVKTDEAQTWDAIRFSQNNFSGMALLGSFSDFNKPFSRTPELTSLGSFEKCWRLEDGDWCLYKLSTVDHLYSELCAYELCKLFGYPTAHYERVADPEQLFGTPLPPGHGVIRTRDFTGGEVNFEPAAALGLEDDDLQGNFAKLRAISPNLATQYLALTTMDVLVYNLDRHTQNFGVLRDRATGDILSMAPNFDNNLSLLSGIRGMGARSYPEDRMYQEWNRFVLSCELVFELPELAGEQLADVIRGVDCPMDAQSQQLVVDFVQAGYRFVRNTQRLVMQGPSPGPGQPEGPAR